MTRFGYLIFGVFLLQSAFGQNIDYQGQIDSLLATKKYAAEAPGISICVQHKGEIIYERCFGLANIKKQIPISTATKFNMASITKQFTACCILILESQGKLSTKDTIQKYLPELPNFGAAITLEHLLAHTSGIPDHLEVLGLKNDYPRKRLKADWTIQFLQQHPFLSFPPGERFAYSNTGYMLLAMVVERITGSTLEAFAAQRIFEPLQMTDSRIANTEQLGLGDSTLSYAWTNQKFKVQKDPEPNAIGATGLFGTVRDLMKWQRALDQFYLPKVKKSVLQKLQQSLSFNDGRSTYYGAGLLLKPYMGHLSREHAGGWNNFLVQCKSLPELELSVIVASNTDANSPFLVCDQICNLFLPAQIAPKPRSTAYANRSLPASAFAGTYIDPGNVVRKLKFVEDTLGVYSLAAPSKPMTKLYFDRVEGDSLLVFMDDQGDTMQFRMDPKGKVHGFLWEGGHYFRHRRYYEKIDGEAAVAISSFAGKFHSKMYGQNLRFKYATKRQGLKLFPIFFKGYALEHLGGPVFKLADDAIFFRFTPTGLVLGNDWVSGLPFDRK